MLLVLVVVSFSLFSFSFPFLSMSLSAAACGPETIPWTSKTAAFCSPECLYACHNLIVPSSLADARIQGFAGLNNTTVIGIKCPFKTDTGSPLSNFHVLTSLSRDPDATK